MVAIYLRFSLKFIYSEKATVHTVKSKGKISQNFVAFSEYMNFIEMGNEEIIAHSFMIRKRGLLKMPIFSKNY